MGLTHRVAHRLFCRWEKQRQLATQRIWLANGGWLQGHRYVKQGPQRGRLAFLGATLLVVLLLPLTFRSHPVLASSSLACVGVVTSLTLSCFLLYGQQAVMSNPRSFAICLSDEWLVLGRRVLLRARLRFLGFETLYMKMRNLAVLVNQLVFFSLCERLLLTNQRVSSLYTLMFFNVMAYCVAYVKELIEREDWSMYVNIARTSNVRHLALSTTKIVLEWTKAITFIITVVFMLLVFGLEKGLKNYSPTTGYLVATGIYFIATEKVFMDMFSVWLDNRKFDYFESMESLYSPALLLASHIFLSSIATVLCIFTGNVRLIMLSSFTNIRVKYRELHESYLEPLRKELAALTDYRLATRSEVHEHDDVCAICLTAMTCARITPCQHFFHADCLRRCLKESNKCPICQYIFV